jgi:hypothetical protein
LSLGNLPGLGPLRESLDTTNALLEKVLEELQRTNGEALSEIAAEVRAQRSILEQLRDQQAPPR